MQSAIYPVRKPLDHDAPRCASRDTLVAPGLTVALAVPVALPRHWPHSGPKWPPCPPSTRTLKLSLLQLGQELGNVSKAGRLMVYHCDALCEVRAPSRSAGSGARLAAPRPAGHPQPRQPRDRARILACGLEYPTYGAQRGGNQLRREGLTVSPSGVRGAWLRHDPALKSSVGIPILLSARRSARVRTTQARQGAASAGLRPTASWTARPRFAETSGPRVGSGLARASGP